MKQAILDQIEFGKKRLEDAGNPIVKAEWSGYIQALRFTLTLLSEPRKKRECTCSAHDLQPFGECQCNINSAHGFTEGSDL